MRSFPLLSRLAALLLAVACLGAAWSFVEAPLLDRVTRDRAEISQDMALITDTGRDQAASAARQRQLARWDALVETASWRLDQASPELVTARLQHLVQGFAADSGAMVSSSRGLPVQGTDPGKILGLEVEVQASPASLRTLLVSIESARPRIFVDRLSVQAPESGLGGEGDLSVALHLSVVALPPRPGAT